MRRGVTRAFFFALTLIAVPVAEGWAQSWPLRVKSDTLCVRGTPDDTIPPPTQRVRVGEDSLRLSAVGSSLVGPGYVMITDTTAIRLKIRDNLLVVLRKPSCPNRPASEIPNALYQISEDTLRIIRGMAVVNSDGDSVRYNVRVGKDPRAVSVGSRVSFFADDSRDLYLFYLRKGEVRADGKSFKDRGQLASFREDWEEVAPDSVQAGLTAAWFKDFTDHSLKDLWDEDPFWKKPIFIGGAVAFVGVVTCVLVCDFNPPKNPTTGGIRIPLPNP